MYGPGIVDENQAFGFSHYLNYLKPSKNPLEEINIDLRIGDRIFLLIISHSPIVIKSTVLGYEVNIDFKISSYPENEVLAMSKKTFPIGSNIYAPPDNSRQIFEEVMGHRIPYGFELSKHFIRNILFKLLQRNFQEKPL